MLMLAGIVSAQIGSNPSNFNNGIALPNATNEGDTLSVSTKFPIMDNAGKINYFANIGDIDGLFTGAVWGSITGTLSDQTDLQAALDAKQATITGAASTIVTSNLPINRALISNGSGKVAESAVTTTELSYVSGVTSALQTQLNAKLNSSSYTAADVFSKVLSLDGSGSGLDADLLDGISSSDFLRTNVNTTRTGGFLRHDDNITERFGTSDDFRILHDGTNNLFQLITGNLILNDGLSTTRFTFGRTTGNFTATGAGEFTGTVSGSDPVNADDFVTKGYGETNFATVTSGTFTPTLIDDGGGATYTFTNSHSMYVKTGPEVTLYIRLTNVNTTGTPSGVILIDNLPFEAEYDAGGSFINFFGANVNYYSIYPRLLASNDYISFAIQQSLDSSIGNLMNTTTMTSGEINLTVRYITP